MPNDGELQQVVTVSFTDVVANRVANDCSHGYEETERHDVDVALTGRYASNDHCGFTRQDEANEYCGLRKGEQPDGDVNEDW